MPIEDITQPRYSVLDLGFSNLLTKESVSSIGDLVTPELLNIITQGIAPKIIISGEVISTLEQQLGAIFSGKTTFNNVQTGYRLGIDTDNLAKFYIGNSTDYLNWDGTSLIIRGNFVIGGTIITVDTFEEIQPALDDVNFVSGGVVNLVPGQTYTATSNIVHYSNTTLNGNGATIDFNGGAYQIQAFGTNVYATGTITVADDSATVVGSGTTWTAAMVGRSILIQGTWYEITTFTDTTHITIEVAFSQSVNAVSGDTYVIADPIFRADLTNLTLQNSTATTGTVYYRYSNNVFMNTVNSLDSTRGWTVQDSSYLVFRDGAIYGCNTGAYLIQSGVNTIESFAIGDSITGDGLNLYKSNNSLIFNFVVYNSAGNGITLENCLDISWNGFAVYSNQGKGIELVANVTGMQFVQSSISNNDSDGIKLTATSDKNTFGHLIILDNGGYGVNIAASTDDDIIINSNTFKNNTSGAIQDLGTGTIIRGNSPSSLNNEVLLTGNQTVAGVKTFSSDPLIPDEAYGSGWNGSLEPPTKNAVYDKIETISTVVGSGQTSRLGSSGTGTQDVAHGLGKTPSLIIVWAFWSNQSGGSPGEGGMSVGTARSTSTDTASGIQVDDYVGTITFQDTAGIIKIKKDGTDVCVANISAIDATNFTLDFTALDNNGGSNVYIQWAAFG